MPRFLPVALIALACASAGEPALDPAVAPRTLASLPPRSDLTERVSEPIDPATTFLAPNTQDADGTPAYVHFTRADMPLRINVDLPQQSARYANRDQTRDAILEGMRIWGEAIQESLPWFAMEFVEGDPSAPVQIAWKRRLSGDVAGRGGVGWEVHEGALRVGGRLEYTTQPCLEISCQLTAAELRLLVAHEFGHALGLAHCHDCDSAMNYAWNTLGRVLVTDHDVRTYLALDAIVPGTRVDGLPLGLLRRSAETD